MEIVTYPHPALLIPTRNIDRDEFKDLSERIGEMFELMRKHDGIGLAAPQVAWSVRLFVTNHTGDKKNECVFINPEVKRNGGAEEAEEGCLSFPGIYAKVKRAEKVEIVYQNEKFERKSLECDGLLARVIQHEYDHLENILLLHRMTEADRSLNRKKLKELKEVLPEQPENGP